MEKPEFEVTGDRYRFEWPATEVRIELERLSEHRDGASAEITIYSQRRPAPGLVHNARFNLVSTQARQTLARSLLARMDDIDWAGALEQVCFLALDRWRSGEPAIDLRTVDPAARPRWLLYPYLEYGGPTVLFAPGGTGKSLLALAAAVTLASGQAVFGTPKAAALPVLYLDWETDRYVHAERLNAICRGAGLHQRPPVFYRRMESSLAEAATGVRREAERLHAGALVLDSLASARGGEPESAEVTLRLFAAIRSLALPLFGVDHVSRAVESNLLMEGRLNPFGSVFTTNAARNTWSIVRAGEEGSPETTVALMHQKTNNGRYERRHGYTLVFENVTDADGEERLHRLTISRCDLAVTELAAALPLKERILAELRGGPKETAALATALDKEAQVIQSRLNELKRAGKVVRLPSRGWGLAARGYGAAAI